VTIEFNLGKRHGILAQKSALVLQLAESVSLQNGGKIMPVIVVANPKGGVGKSTLATNLAGYFAKHGHGVMLGDADLQQSSRSWLAIRPATLPRIKAWEIAEGHVARPPKGTTHIVLDTPAGLDNAHLDEVLRIADKVVVPLQASMFDILATQAFLEKLIERKGKFAIGIIGMRVNVRTRAADQLAHYVNNLKLPVLGCLRDTQNYVQLAAAGATLWDVAPSRVEKDVEQWEKLLAWLG
jgi:chromosome partitioning protein